MRGRPLDKPVRDLSSSPVILRSRRNAAGSCQVHQWDSPATSCNWSVHWQRALGHPKQLIQACAQVVLNNAVLDLPRDSCSREMYRIRAASMRAVAPMSQAQLDRMKPNMDA